MTRSRFILHLYAGHALPHETFLLFRPRRFGLGLRLGLRRSHARVHSCNGTARVRSRPTSSAAKCAQAPEYVPRHEEEHHRRSGEERRHENSTVAVPCQHVAVLDLRAQYNRDKQRDEQLSFGHGLEHVVLGRCISGGGGEQSAGCRARESRAATQHSRPKPRLRRQENAGHRHAAERLKDRPLPSKDEEAR